MEILEIKNLSFTYPNREAKALDNISITVRQGEFLLLCGASGCGKTTLLRLLKPSLSPFGTSCGEILFEGKRLALLDLKDEASKIGFVLQNAESSIVTDKVFKELSFGLESLGLKSSEIRARVSEIAAFFDLESLFHKPSSELSGGQKQLLCLASVMAMHPDVLILDEPTSQLDPIAAQQLLQAVKKINLELGVTVILSEHRLEEAFSLADRVIVMDDGKIIADEIPSRIGRALSAMQHNMYKALPAPMRIHSAVSNEDTAPVSVRDGRLWLEDFAGKHCLDTSQIPQSESKKAEGSPIISARELHFKYDKSSDDVLKGLSFDVFKGEIFAVLGSNGAGKSTLLNILAGISKPYSGKLSIDPSHKSSIALLPQNPQLLFLKGSVYLDLLDALSESEFSKEEKEERIKNVCNLCRIENLIAFNPYDLSGGEQQRVALAKALLTSPEILLLDEPTKGFDAEFKQLFAQILSSLSESGITIIMVSHDIEFCAEVASRCAMLFDGDFSSTAEPREFFSEKSFYTTSSNRMARKLLPKAILAEDVILACGKLPPKLEKPQTSNPDKWPGNKKNDIVKPFDLTRKKRDKPPLFSVLLLLFIIPVTVLSGFFFLDEKKYYITSLIVIAETIIPFFMLFESRKPRARELVIISLLCAIAVAGRAAFFMIPQFKPVIAIVIISGVCFGGEAGFLVGALTAFVSNFFFGQGPWTPWQMFALGIIGFLSGLLFRRQSKKSCGAFLYIFGFFATLVIYGGIMNCSTVLLAQENPTLEMLLAAIVVALPLDFIHSLSTVVFLAIATKSLTEKLNRVKIKYGLIL